MEHRKDTETGGGQMSEAGGKQGSWMEPAQPPCKHHPAAPMTTRWENVTALRMRCKQWRKKEYGKRKTVLLYFFFM